MSKIDTTGWQEFALADLCDIVLSHDDLQPKRLSDGDVRLVSAGTSNNGVVMHCDAPDAEIFEAGCVTVDMFGQCFWQDEPFVAVSHGRINVLRFKEHIGRDAGKAFASILDVRLADKYSFENMCNMKRLQSETILLPAVSVEEPDWDYMEQYMAQVMDEMRPVAEELHGLDSKLTRHKLDTTEWKMFKIGELFDVTRPTRSRSFKDYDEGDVRYVASGVGDTKSECYKTEGPSAKGVVAWLAPHDDDDMDAGDCITISPVDGWAFYQDEDFLGRGGAGSSIIICRRKGGSMRDGCGEFVATVMTLAFSSWSYSSMGNADLVSNSKIPLPVDVDGNPDWAYMSHTHTHLRGDASSRGDIVPTPWMRFRVGKLFEVQHGSRLNKSDRVEGEISFVTAGFENRGVAQHVGNDVELYANPITVDMFGNSFYQEGEVSGDDNVYFFVNDGVSVMAKQFVSTVITSACAGKFDYGRQFRQGDADALSVLLPATLDGEPDWDKMATMMQGCTDSVRDVAETVYELGR